MLLRFGAIINLFVKERRGTVFKVSGESSGFCFELAVVCRVLFNDQLHVFD